MRAHALVLRLERRVCDFVAGRGVVRPGEHLLLMLSGGADSMAMLAMLRAADRRLRLGLAMAALHVDYGLRGADSTRDREIVATACAAAGIELDVVTLEGRLHGPDFQARARELRYAKAQEAAACRGCTVVAAAHNRDDQAETILYRLAKYASPRGLVGMRPREEGAPGRAALARPLLCLGADEVRAYCAARGIAYGEDVTNAAPVYARNVVRHEVLAKLATLNPRVAETLAAGAEVAAAERDVIDAAVDAAWARVVAATDGDEFAALDLTALAREPEAVRALLLRRLAGGARGPGALVERREIEALARLASRRDDAGSATLRGGWEVVRGGERLALRRRTPAHACPLVVLPLGRRTPFCGRRYSAELLDGAVRPPEGGSVAAGAPPLEAFVGMDAPPPVLALRHPVRGDRFAPCGMGAETTVARFLAGARVPRPARARARVLDAGGRVAWVGYGTSAGERRGRVAESFRVTQSTRYTLHVVEEAR